MTINRFLIELLLVTLGTLIVLLLLGWCFPILSPHQQAGWWSLFLFIALSIPMFLLSKIAARSKNKYLFSNVSFFFVFTKMVAVIIAILCYKKMISPNSNWFVVPFFVVYIFFTIFEVYFMIKNSNNPHA